MPSAARAGVSVAGGAIGVPFAGATTGRRAAPRGARELSAAIARGDADALDEFYRLWFDRALAGARRLTRRDESFCLDVVQEAMIRVARSMPPLAGPDDLDRWMTRVLHTAAIDLLRREQRQAARARRSFGERPASDASPVDLIAQLREALRKMDHGDRGLLLLRFGRGRSLAQAGSAAGMSESAAYGRIRRALGRLRRTLEDPHDDH